MVQNMVPMIRPALEIRQSQQLVLTPQLQQALRLLQLSSLDLQQEISQALTENPVLELESPEPAAESVAAEDLFSGGGGPRQDGDDDFFPEAAATPSLREHLLGQISCTRASRRDLALMTVLIDELDDNGYLAASFEEILAYLPESLEVEQGELEAALALLQNMEPAGIAARTMSECLLLQLRQPDAKVWPEARDAAIVALARRLCERHLDALAAGRLAFLCEELKCSPAEVRTAHALIRRLDPYPGRAWTVPVADFSVPDVIAYRSGNGWRVRLNGDLVPRLSVNDAYVQALGQEPRGSYEGLQSHVQQARWLIRQVAQRFDTLLRVSTEIVARQQAFFESGMVALRPMVLREIAEALGMHESTISRATSSKYMATPHGTLELKRFFSTGVPAADGESASAASIQAMMREMLDQEDPRKPLSDSQLMAKLAERGVELARRTVAKYREGMRVPTASQRKAMALMRMDDC